MTASTLGIAERSEADVTTVWRSNLRSFVTTAALVLVLCIVAPPAASAAIYYPTGSAGGDNDLQDLDHQFYYTWVISGLSAIPTTTNITSASITFRNLWNWNGEENILHLDLLDYAKVDGNLGSGGQEISDATVSGYRTRVNKAGDSASVPESPTKAELSDDALDVDGTNLTALASTSTPRINLDNRSFVGAGANPVGTTATNPALSTLYYQMTHLPGSDFTMAQLGTSTSGPDSELFSLASWEVGTCYAGEGCDYTYTFDTTELGILKGYINNDGMIALGFDPDCHFYNDGLSFQFATGSSSPAVPEPATLVLVGTGLIGAARYRRRKRDLGKE